MNRVTCWICALFLSHAGMMSTGEVAAPVRLPRTNLLVYHDRTGGLAPVRRKGEWLKRRAEIVIGMQAIMGPLPGPAKRCPLEIKTEAEVDCGSHIRKF